MANMTVKERDALTKLKLEAKTICEKYGVDMPLIVFNSRLRTTAGRIYFNMLENGRIELATNYFKEFGFDRSLGTLRHELAHLIAFVKYGERGHGFWFKEICQVLGGTMSPKLAGFAYAACATDEYVQNVKKWRYTCSCGLVYNRKNKLTAAKAHTYKCTVCGTRVSNMALSLNEK